MSKAVDRDRAYFVANPTENYRIRRASKGEPEEIVARAIPAGSDILTKGGGELAPPSSDSEWYIVAIHAGAGNIVRLLTIDQVGDPGRIAKTPINFLTVVARRVAVDMLATQEPGK